MPIFTLISASSTLLLAVYAVQNTSGHTGLNPYMLMPLYLITLAAALMPAISGATFSKKHVYAAITSVVGIALLIGLDYSNTLLQYETWLERGMP